MVCHEVVADPLAAPVGQRNQRAVALQHVASFPQKCRLRRMRGDTTLPVGNIE